MNVFQLNSMVNNSRSSGFAQAVNNAVKQAAISGVNFISTSTGTINFKTQAGTKAAVASIVEIDKR